MITHPAGRLKAPARSRQAEWPHDHGLGTGRAIIRAASLAEVCPLCCTKTLEAWLPIDGRISGISKEAPTFSQHRV